VDDILNAQLVLDFVQEFVTLFFNNWGLRLLTIDGWEIKRDYYQDLDLEIMSQSIASTIPNNKLIQPSNSTKSNRGLTQNG